MLHDFINDYHDDFQDLRKIITNWELIPDYSKHYYNNFTNRVLDALNQDANEKKIHGIIETELIIGLGFYSDEIDVNNYITDIFSWWNKKEEVLSY